MNGAISTPIAANRPSLPKISQGNVNKPFPVFAYLLAADDHVEAHHDDVEHHQQRADEDAERPAPCPAVPRQNM